MGLLGTGKEQVVAGILPGKYYNRRGGHMSEGFQEAEMLMVCGAQTGQEGQ